MEPLNTGTEEEVAKITIVGSINVSSSSDAVFTAQNFSLAIEDTILISDANIVLLRGHRYGLVGENGTGKSTLMQAILSRLESDADTSLSVAYVGQNDAERSTNVDSTVLEYCLEGNAHIKRLKDEMASLEDDDHSDHLHAAERIGAIMEQLEDYERTEPAKRALATLRSLGFTKKSSEGPVDGLSGGWRTRLEIARSLFAQPNVLMLDEPTNHLDLHAVLHLASMLRHSAMKNTTLIVVSHDASFLDLVCTDIIAVHNQHMQCFSGNYAEFEKKAEEYRASHERRYKNRIQEEARQKESIVQAKAKARKSTNDKALKQAASRERKAATKIGLYREDGKRYKLNSLKTLDIKAVRLPARAEPVRVGKTITLRFPPSSSSISSPLVVVDDLNFGYEGLHPVLNRITCTISGGDRIALVGKNGSGKSTLIRALMGTEDVKISYNAKSQGHVQRRGRVALLDQNQLALLAEYLDLSSVELLAQRYPYSETSRFKNEGDIRSHLGGFGLSGDTALLPINELSGGLRVRLCLADLFADTMVPDLLLLDEPTNHLDAETTEALSNALKTFEGAVLVVSHNFGFLMSVCRDLWLCEGGALKIQRHSDTKDFVHHFRQFASQIISKDDRADLDLVLTVRATRNALVIQGNAQHTSLLV